MTGREVRSSLANLANLPGELAETRQYGRNLTTGQLSRLHRFASGVRSLGEIPSRRGCIALRFGRSSRVRNLCGPF